MLAVEELLDLAVLVVAVLVFQVQEWELKVQIQFFQLLHQLAVEVVKVILLQALWQHQDL